MNNLYDIIKKNGEKHIVIKIVRGLGARVETMSLRRYIEENRIIQYQWQWMTVAELLDREVNIFLEE